MLQWLKRIFGPERDPLSEAPPLPAAIVVPPRAPPPRPIAPEANPPTVHPRPQFRTAAVGALFNEVAKISHSEHPFLDREYSPSTLMPAADFAPWIANMRLQRNEAAIDELLTYLTYPPQLVALKKTMAAANLRRYIRGDDRLIEELWAVFCLAFRASAHGADSSRVHLLEELLTHSLASWPFEVVADSIPHLVAGANAIIRKRQRDGVNDAPLLAGDSFTPGQLPPVSSVGERLQSFPVTFRACVTYSVQRGSPVVGCIRPQLDGHYGLRQFGLARDQSIVHFAAAEFFQTPDDLASLADRLKKDDLLAVAGNAGILAKKSAKKEELIALLLADAKGRELVALRGKSELVQVRASARAAFDQWELRVRRAHAVALGLACA